MKPGSIRTLYGCQSRRSRELYENLLRPFCKWVVRKLYHPLCDIRSNRHQSMITSSPSPVIQHTSRQSSHQSWAATVLVVPAIARTTVLVVWMDTCRRPICWLAVSPLTSIKHDDVILLLVDHRCKGWWSLVQLVVVSISQGVIHCGIDDFATSLYAYNNSRCSRNITLGVSQHHHDVDPDIIRRRMFAKHQI